MRESGGGGGAREVTAGWRKSNSSARSEAVVLL